MALFNLQTAYLEEQLTFRSMMKGNVLVLTVSRVLWSMSDTIARARSSEVLRKQLSLLVGGLVDRIGTRTCMLIGFAIAIPTMSIFTYMNNFWTVVPVYVALITASSLMWISSSVYLANTIPRATRGRIMSGLGSGMSIGVSGGGYASGFLVFIPMAIGSKLGGLIYTYNPAYPWFIQSIFLSVGMALCYLYIKDPKKMEQ